MSGRFYRTACAIGRPIVRGSVRCVVGGEDCLPATGGAMLAANHESYFDAMIVSGLCPRPVRWLSALGRVPGPLRTLLRALDVIPLAESGRDHSAVRETLSVLRGGALVGAFPEGGIPRPGERAIDGGPVQASVFKLARLAGVPVIPCAVAGSHVFGHWRAWLPASGKTCVVLFGEPLDPRDDRIGADYRQALARLHERACGLAGSISGK